MQKKKLDPCVSELAKDIRGRYFPLALGKGIVCEAVSGDECREFVQKKFNTVFPLKSNNLYTPNSRLAGKMKPIRDEYRTYHSEYFLFRVRGKAVGWMMGEIEDFETFYMRNSGILPQFRGKGFYGTFIKHFLRYLQELGYQRVSSQHAPDNRDILNIKLGLGFILVGTENHERWGQLIKAVKIFDKKREQAFKNKFL